MLKCTVNANGQLHGTVGHEVVACNEKDFLKFVVKETTNEKVIRDSAEYRILNMKAYGKSWQKATEGHQLGDFSRFQSTSMGGATLTNNGDGSLTISGSGTLTSSFNAQVDYTHEETISLIRSGRLYALIETLVVPYLYLYLIYDNGNKKAELYCLSGTHEHTDITEEMLDDSCYLCIGFYGSTGDEIKSGTIKPMLYQDGDGTWEPFTHGATPNPNYPQPIESAKEVKVLGGNYFNINNFDVDIQDNGVYVQDNGFAMPNYYNVSYTTLGALCPELKAGDEVYLNFEVVNAGSTSEFYLYGSGRDWILGNSLVITQADLDDGFSIYGIDGETTIYKNIVVSKEPIPFEPYKEPQTLTLPYELNGADGVYDEVDFERKKFIQRWLRFRPNKTIVFSGETSDVANRYVAWLPDFMENYIPLKHGDSISFSNMAKWSNWATGEDGTFCMVQDAFWYKDTTKTLDEVNAIFADLGTDVEIVVQLLEPIETDLTDEEVALFKALHTNYPTTTIVADGEVEVTYVADTKNYIDKQLGIF